MAILLHVTTRKAWDDATLAGEYRGDTLDTEGFIHCATPAQLAGVVRRYFAGQGGLVLLRIDEGSVRPPIRRESPPGSAERFPHVYGPLNLDAVIDVTPLEGNIG